MNDIAIKKNIKKYTDFASWFIWYPDLALDLMAPAEGGIKLNTDQRIFMRAGTRFFTEHGCFPRGYGKCVVGDTQIFTDQGQQEIGSFFDYQSDRVETEYLQGIKVINLNGDIVDAPFGIYNGYKMTLRISVKEGLTLSGTYNHPVLIMDKDGNTKFKALRDLTVGDTVCISTNNGLFGDKTSIDVFDDLAYWVDNLPYADRKLKIKDLPHNLTPDLAYLFGILTSERCTIVKSRIPIDFKENTELTEFCRRYFVEGLGSYLVKYITGEDSVSDSYLRKYLDLCKLTLAHKDNKEVPPLILSAPREMQKNFLSGIFDAMGEFNENSLQICSICKKLLKQLQMMLLNFGIVSTYKEYNKRRNEKCYLIIDGYDLRIFYNEIGLRTEYKRKPIEELLNRQINTSNRRSIPYQKKYLSSLYFDMKEKYPELYNVILPTVKGNGLIVYSKLGSILDLEGVEKSESYNHLKELYDNNYYYTKITKIEKMCSSHVYDLNVPEGHSFVSNGFISHNTWTEFATMNMVAVRYPNIMLSLSAQTMENAAKLLKDKFNELTRQYPMLLNEVEDFGFTKNSAHIDFKNKSSITAIANSQNSKGLRRHRLNIEESNLMDNALFEDALAPVVEIGRTTTGKMAIVNPEELNQQINFFTTPGFRSSSEHERNLKLVQDMIDLNGAIVLGSDWKLGCWYGRGSSKAAILKKKKDMSPITFQMNYGGTWVGSSDGALVSINKMMECRTLSVPELAATNETDEYYIGVDVARSQKKSNNQSSIAVGKVIRESSGKIKEIHLVNIIHMSNTLNFETQACIVKRIRKKYNARKVVVDGNGLILVPLYGNIYRITL